jgi:hypothetical protein
MTIDLERLAVDAGYWDEVAPEGASHFMYSEKFVKWVDGVEWAFYTSSDKAWKKSMCSWSLQRYTDNGNEVIAKPSKPAAQEWDGEGLPPVGTECEVIESDGLMYGQGESGKVIAHVETTAVIRMSYGLGCFEARHLCPIRSQAWREYEELGRDIIDDLNALGINLSAKKVEIFARSIINKGYSKGAKKC